ncbi:MAG TPA: hypothetical protein VK568_11195, partial [Thermodesulfobacteriota bacterium]|nr:hypothetical protein [Thermodesulfobacteriota bacterium]
PFTSATGVQIPLGTPSTISIGYDVMWLVDFLFLVNTPNTIPNISLIFHPFRVFHLIRIGSPLLLSQPSQPNSHP